jgi:hypothetical protein
VSLAAGRWQRLDCVRWAHVEGEFGSPSHHEYQAEVGSAPSPASIRRFLRDGYINLGETGISSLVCRASDTTSETTGNGAQLRQIIRLAEWVRRRSVNAERNKLCYFGQRAQPNACSDPPIALPKVGPRDWRALRPRAPQGALEPRQCRLFYTMCSETELHLPSPQASSRDLPKR